LLRIFLFSSGCSHPESPQHLCSLWTEDRISVQAPVKGTFSNDVNVAISAYQSGVCQRWPIY
jgi:hypothetical protein